MPTVKVSESMTQMGLNRVFSFVNEHESRLHQIIKSLIKKPSDNPPGDTSEAAEVAASLLSASGFKVELVTAAKGKVNVVAEWNIGQQETILFNGHLDTVPAGDIAQWEFDPYSAKVSEGWMYGRGAADDKGAVGCVIAACEAIRRLGLTPKANILIHAVCDEEVGSKCGTSHLIRKGYAKASRGYVTEASTSENRVFVRNSMKGTAVLNITVKGESAHAANPYDGVNANLEMSRVLLALNRIKFRCKRSRYLTAPTIAAGTILQGGEKSNVIPAVCASVSDVRYLPGMTEGTMRKDIERIIERVKRRDKKLNLSYEFELAEHRAVEVEPHEPVVRKARDMIRRVTGYNPRIMGGYGATDASHLILDAHIPTLIGLGPADIDLGNMHGVDEKVSTARLIDYTKIYAGLILNG